MSWLELLREGRVERAETTKLELDELRRLVELNLRDAAVPGISDDLHFGVAYDAARLLA